MKKGPTLRRALFVSLARPQRSGKSRQFTPSADSILPHRTPPHPPSTPLRPSCRSVIKAYQSCDRQIETLPSECGLTTAQFDALSAIEAPGGNAKLPEVAADRRVTFCLLTREGRRRLAKAQRAATQFVEYQLAPFSDEECAVVDDVMRRMLRQLESMDTRALARRKNSVPGEKS